MAGDATFARLLLGMGLRQFSMHPAQMLSVKQEILRSEIAQCAALTKKDFGGDRSGKDTDSDRQAAWRVEWRGSLGASGIERTRAAWRVATARVG